MRLRVGRVRIESSNENEKTVYSGKYAMAWMIITDDEKINEILGTGREGMRLAGVNGDKKRRKRVKSAPMIKIFLFI